MQTGLIVDDIVETQSWLENIMDKAFPGINITNSSSVRNAKKSINDNHFGIALVDLGLPDGSGCEVIKHLKEKIPDCYIIVVTIFDDDPHLITAFKAGIHGYLLKDTPEHLITAKLRSILNGDPPLSPSIARKLLRCFTEHTTTDNSTSQPQQADKLSPREIDVITLVAKGYSRKEIARLLDLSVNTVSRYIKGAYSKLNISNKAEAAIEACRIGLIDSDKMH